MISPINSDFRNSLISPALLLARHQSGDWGELSAHNRRENEPSIREGLRVLSNYPLPNGSRVWVITESDRSSTCLLLPDEY